jgi:FkbM family methyltransferase
MPATLTKLKEFVLCASSVGQTLTQKSVILWRETKNVRARLGLARYHPEHIYELPTRFGKIFLRDNFGDITNLPDLLYRNVYGCEHLQEDGVILDIGANIGLFAVWAAFLNPGRQIFCFEPLASNVRLIGRNCPTAIVHRVALGRVRATKKLRVDHHSIMASSVATSWPTIEEEFEVIPLDEFVRQHAIERVAFMKIDTEGMEVEILDGARETLCKTIRISMETHSPELHRQVAQRLSDAGFAIEDKGFTDGTGLLIGVRR